MFRRTKLCSSILLAFGGAVALVGVPAFGQELERVEVTGSAIKRIASETALPIQTISKKEIEKSGATSTTDLLQRLPAMQNSTVEGSAVGGETYGFTGVSIHNIGETRTLVLLNGRRVAKLGGQAVTGALNGVDLNSLPVSAIERIEILTDGASALYGADAVAGVVNFITAKRADEGTLSVGFSNPQHGGAEEFRWSLTRGIGDLAKDGFNVNLALSYDKRGTMAATQRDFAKTGLVKYVDEDSELLSADTGNATSKRSVPANLNLYDANGDQVTRLNPFLAVNGTCPPFHIKSGDSCRFDFTSQLEIYPDRERTNAYVSFDKQLTADLKWSTELLMGRTTSTSRIAPPPGEIPIIPGTPAYNTAIALAKSQGYYPIGSLPGAGDPALVDTFDPNTMDSNLRFTELGKRTNVNEISSAHFATGLDGTMGGIDFSTSWVHSQNTVSDTFDGGYASTQGVASLAFLGFNQFLGVGEQSAQGQAAANAAKVSGYWNGGKSILDVVSGQGAMEIGQLPGGPVQLALGTNLMREVLKARTSDLLAGKITYEIDADGNPCKASGKPCVGTSVDQRFGDSGIQPSYKAQRKTLGIFGELGLPISKEFEATTSLRFDHQSDFGNSLNGKLALRYQPTKSILLRGSFGTGYIAPSLAQINAPLQGFGVTSDSYDCTAIPALQTIANNLTAASGKTVLCDSGAQFQQFAEGTSSLKPEKSKQLTLGIAFEPAPNLRLGADFWSVQLTDQIGQKPEQIVFADPLKYEKYFTVFTDPLTQKRLVAFYQPNENLGKALYTGIDFNANAVTNLGFAKWNSNLIATLMLKSAQQFDKGGQYFSDLAGKDDIQTVAFRWKGKFINTVDIGDWSNTFTVNFQSGYQDSATNPNIETGPNAGNTKDGYRVQVKAFYSYDWSSTYQLTKFSAVNFGVLNLTDKKPPFVFSQGGLNRGQEVGWDGRYFDPRGRTFFLNGNVRF
jgi:iron complex outermembrane recepter protein